ncbi:hypothetical protein Tco_0372083, partial [Tanacetum coccineum]
SYLHAAVESIQAVETLQWENIVTVGSSSNSGNHSTNSGNPLAFYSQHHEEGLFGETSSKILLGGDGSYKKTFKPIASLIMKGKLK